MLPSGRFLQRPDIPAICIPGLFAMLYTMMFRSCFPVNWNVASMFLNGRTSKRVFFVSGPARTSRLIPPLFMKPTSAPAASRCASARKVPIALCVSLRVQFPLSMQITWSYSASISRCIESAITDTGDGGRFPCVQREMRFPSYCVTRPPSTTISSSPRFSVFDPVWTINTPFTTFGWRSRVCECPPTMMASPWTPAASWESSSTPWCVRAMTISVFGFSSSMNFCAVSRGERTLRPTRLFWLTSSYSSCEMSPSIPSLSPPLSMMTYGTFPTG